MSLEGVTPRRVKRVSVAEKAEGDGVLGFELAALSTSHFGLRLRGGVAARGRHEGRRRKVVHKVMVGANKPTGVPVVLTCHSNSMETINKMNALGIASERGNGHEVIRGREMVILFPPVRKINCWKGQRMARSS
jgi:hypothetical protein